jgi:hypothetical protein
MPKGVINSGPARPQNNPLDPQTLATDNIDVTRVEICVAVVLVPFLGSTQHDSIA